MNVQFIISDTPEGGVDVKLSADSPINPDTNSLAAKTAVWLLTKMKEEEEKARNQLVTPPTDDEVRRIRTDKPTAS